MPTMKQLFEEFDAAHQEVYPVYVRFAEELRAAGVTKIRADEVLHRVRWEMLTTEMPEIEMNNLFGNRYAMKLMTEDPSYKGFFDLTVVYTDAFRLEEERG